LQVEFAAAGQADALDRATGIAFAASRDRGVIQAVGTEIKGYLQRCILCHGIDDSNIDSCDTQTLSKNAAWHVHRFGQPTAGVPGPEISKKNPCLTLLANYETPRLDQYLTICKRLSVKQRVVPGPVGRAIRIRRTGRA
jgi:hypothetical protein